MDLGLAVAIGISVKCRETRLAWSLVGNYIVVRPPLVDRGSQNKGLSWSTPASWTADVRIWSCPKA